MNLYNLIKSDYFNFHLNTGLQKPVLHGEGVSLLEQGEGGLRLLGGGHGNVDQKILHR